MSFVSKILDGVGRKRAAAVTSRNALQVAMVEPDVPAIGTPNVYRYLSRYLTDDGLATGSANQNVDGSSTPQTFYLTASADYDIRITHILILISDSGVSHNNFGALSALSNGWDLEIVEAGVSTYLVDKAQTGGQVIAQTGFFWPYGDGATSWELANWTGSTDAQTINFPLGNIIPGGLRLGRGTQDKIVATVNDSLTGLTEMWVRVMGFRHYPCKFCV